MMQADLFGDLGPTEPTADEIMNLDPEYLYKKYQAYYDDKHKEYEQKLEAMGRMKKENRVIPSYIQDKIENALLLQRYITAKSEDNPHQYCLRKDWRGETSFTTAAQIIRNYGYVEWFWRKPYMMFNLGEFKYWSMGWPLDVTVLINRRPLIPCSRAELLEL